MGMMGSGKSSIGKLVSKKLDIPFADIDSLIVENTGMSVLEIFEKKGEDYFRNLEEKITLQYLKKLDMLFLLVVVDLLILKLEKKFLLIIFHFG